MLGWQDWVVQVQGADSDWLAIDATSWCCFHNRGAEVGLIGLLLCAIHGWPACDSCDAGRPVCD